MCRVRFVILTKKSPPGVVQSQTEEVVKTETDEIENQSKIYIGMDGAFTEYNVSNEFEEYDDSEDVSDYLEALIDEMGTLTGWDLDCDISVYKTVGVAFENNGTSSRLRFLHQKRFIIW